MREQFAGLYLEAPGSDVAYAAWVAECDRQARLAQEQEPGRVVVIDMNVCDTEDMPAPACPGPACPGCPACVDLTIG